MFNRFNYRDDRIKLSLFEARENRGDGCVKRVLRELYIPGSFK